METRLELTLTLHGLDTFQHEVDAMVFARKLAAFLRGIKHSDSAANGGKTRHKLLLTDLRKNTATASVREQMVVKGPLAASGMAYYSRAVDAIYNKRPEARALPIVLLNDIVSLNRGAGHSFAFGELKSNLGQLIRIDDYLARTVESLIIERATADQVAEIAERSFSGIAYGSYDGVLKAVDLRGDVKKGKLVLTAGGREIECTLNALTTPELQTALDSRVMAYGRAHYEKSSGLPVRLDVTKAEPVVAQPSNLAGWKGAFKIPDGGTEEWD